MRADIEIIAEDHALGLREFFRLCKIRPVVIDHDAEIDRRQHRRQRRADVSAAEDIREARLRERLDVIGGVALFDKGVGKEHRAERFFGDAVGKAQAVRFVIGSHGADAAAVHPADEPAVLVAVQKLQDAAQQRFAVRVRRVKILKIHGHIAAADHADVRDLIGAQAVALHERLLGLQGLHRLFTRAQLDCAAADGAFRMAVGEHGHACAGSARCGARGGENAAQHDALAARERLQHGCKQRFHNRSSICMRKMPSRLICGR